MTTIDEILRPGHASAQGIAELDAQIAHLNKLIGESRVTELLATLDDLPLVSLDALNATLSIGYRRALVARNKSLADDYSEQLRVVQAEICERTVRLAHRAGMAWTAAEESRLQRLARCGETIECIASALGRTLPSVSLRAAGLGIQFGDDGRAVTSPVFEVDGSRLSLAELLTAKTIDDTLRDWASTARVGDVLSPAGVRCERVS